MCRYSAGTVLVKLVPTSIYSRSLCLVSTTCELLLVAQVASSRFHTAARAAICAGDAERRPSVAEDYHALGRRRRASEVLTGCLATARTTGMSQGRLTIISHGRSECSMQMMPVAADDACARAAMEVTSSELCRIGQILGACDTDGARCKTQRFTDSTADRVSH